MSVIRVLACVFELSRRAAIIYNQWREWILVKIWQYGRTFSGDLVLLLHDCRNSRLAVSFAKQLNFVFMRR